MNTPTALQTANESPGPFRWSLNPEAELRDPTFVERLIPAVFMAVSLAAAIWFLWALTAHLPQYPAILLAFLFTAWLRHSKASRKRSTWITVVMAIGLAWFAASFSGALKAGIGFAMFKNSYVHLTPWEAKLFSIDLPQIHWDRAIRDVRYDGEDAPQSSMHAVRIRLRPGMEVPHFELAMPPAEAEIRRPHSAGSIWWNARRFPNWWKEEILDADLAFIETWHEEEGDLSVGGIYAVNEERNTIWIAHWWGH
jgi:hypothetical protein